MQNYLEIEFKIASEWHELAVAVLSELSFDSFLEEENLLKAYILEQDLNEELLKENLELIPADDSIEYKVGQLENKNWNEEWESNFDPVFIDKDVVIRARFHDIQEDYPYTIHINPRMSFGTGHHATTHLIVKTLVDMDLTGQSVFDAGTGTGVLAIMAKLKGSTDIETCDIDDWSIDNAAENFELNGATDIKIAKGTFEETKTKGKQYQLILANINRNVLLKDMPHYAAALDEKGYLVLSGFYSEDRSSIVDAAQAEGLAYVSGLEKDNWLALKFQK